MTHVRQDIRDRLKTVLGSLEPTIYKVRRYALDDSDLPAICIYTQDERSDPATIGARTLRRSLDVVVEIVLVGPSATVCDTLDTTCESVEALIGADYEDEASPALGSFVKEFMLSATSTDINVDGGKAIAVAQLNYNCVYYTNLIDAGTAI